MWFRAVGFRTEPSRRPFADALRCMPCHCRTCCGTAGSCRGTTSSCQRGSWSAPLPPTCGCSPPHPPRGDTPRQRTKPHQPAPNLHRVGAWRKQPRTCIGARRVLVHAVLLVLGGARNRRLRRLQPVQLGVRSVAKHLQGRAWGLASHSGFSTAPRPQPGGQPPAQQLWLHSGTRTAA